MKLFKYFLCSFLPITFILPIVFVVSCSSSAIENNLTFVGESSIKLDVGYETHTQKYSCKIDGIVQNNNEMYFELSESEDSLNVAINENGVLTIPAGISIGNYQITIKATWLKQPSVFKTLIVSLKISDPNNKYPEYDDYYNFINARTFSIRFKTVTSPTTTMYTFGTGWIFEIIDSVQPNNNEYDYYVATNYHVVYDPFNCGTGQKMNYDLDLGFSNYNSESGAFSDINYLNLTDKEWEILYVARFNDVTPEPDPSNAYFADFAVLSIDLENHASQNGMLKAHLDYLNYYSSEITKDDSTIEIAPKTQPINLNSYTLGYPFIKYNPTTLYATPRVEKSQINKFVSCDHNINSINNYTYKYYLDENAEVKTQFCIADQYFHGPSLLSNLSGGASGSLTINENYQVVGIYWGGWSSTSNPEINQGSTQPLIVTDSKGNVKYNLIEMFHKSLL